MQSTFKTLAERSAILSTTVGFKAEIRARYSLACLIKRDAGKKASCKAKNIIMGGTISSWKNINIFRTKSTLYSFAEEGGRSRHFVRAVFQLLGLGGLSLQVLLSATAAAIFVGSKASNWETAENKGPWTYPASASVCISVPEHHS